MSQERRAPAGEHARVVRHVRQIVARGDDERRCGPLLEEERDVRQVGADGGGDGEHLDGGDVDYRVEVHHLHHGGAELDHEGGRAGVVADPAAGCLDADGEHEARGQDQTSRVASLHLVSPPCGDRQ